MKAKHLVMACLLLAILTLSAVSASDDALNMTADDAQEDTVDVPFEDDDELTEPTSDYGRQVKVPELFIRESGDYCRQKIEINLPTDATGTIVAYLDGNTEPIYNDTPHYVDRYSPTSNVILNFNDKVVPDFGRHSILVWYSGDYNYIGFYEDHYFDVTYFMESNHDYEVEWGDALDVVVWGPGDTDGNMTLTINNISYPAMKTSTDYQFQIMDYSYGVNNFTIALVGDSKYPDKSIDYSFEAKSHIFADDSMVYGDESFVTLMMAIDASGTLNVNVDGRKYAEQRVTDGKARVLLAGLGVGKHIITASYAGDDYDVYGLEINNFTVYPYEFVPEHVYSGFKNYTVTVAVDENATGTLKISSNETGEELVSQKINGTVSFNISSYLTAITIEYVDGDFYCANDYQISKSDTDPYWKLNITYNPTFLKGESNYIHVDGNPADADMNYVIYVDGRLHSEGPAIIDTTDLSLASHEFTIFAIDRKGYYVTQNASGAFNVSSAVFEIPDEIVHGFAYSTLIHTLLPENATGNVRLIIDGKDYAMEFVDEGIVDIDLADLACGVYDYEIIYSGNYPSASQKGKLNVTYAFRANMADKYFYGEKIEIAVSLPYDATGNVSLSVAGVYNSTVAHENGLARLTFTLPLLDVGSYNVTVTYMGDDKYSYPQTANMTFSVEGYEITSPRGTIYYGDDEWIALVLPQDATGSLNVTIDGRAFAGVMLENGTAKVSLKNVTPAKHSILASYSGNYAVDPLEIPADDFEVKVRVSYSEEVVLNQTAWISVIIPEDASGFITITFDGDEEHSHPLSPAEIRNYTFTCDKLGYTFFTLKYTGEDYPSIKFEDYWGDLTLYSIKGTPYNVTVPESEGGDEIVLELPEDARGNLTVYCWSTDDGWRYVPVMNMSVSGPLVGLSLAGLGYSGDMKFEYADDKYGTYTQYFGYSPSKPTAAMAISGISDDNAATLSFTLPGDASGSLIVSVNGKYYYVDLAKGKASISIDGLSSGKQLIGVTYSGSDKYERSHSNMTVDVIKAVPAKIVAKDTSVMYTAGTKYSVTVYGIDGAVAKNVEVVFKLNGKKVATAKTDSNGVATYNVVQLPGSYKITAEARGAKVTKKLTVKHVVKLPKVKVKRSAKKLVIKVTLNKVNGKFLKNKKVTLKFKGKKYVAKTNKKGVAKFTIKSKVLKKLKKGKKVTYQATYLKDTVKRTVKVKK